MASKSWNYCAQVKMLNKQYHFLRIKSPRKQKIHKLKTKQQIAIKFSSKLLVKSVYTTSYKLVVFTALCFRNEALLFEFYQYSMTQTNFKICIMFQVENGIRFYFKLNAISCLNEYATFTCPMLICLEVFLFAGILMIHAPHLIKSNDLMCMEKIICQAFFILI